MLKRVFTYGVVFMLFLLLAQKSKAQQMTLHNQYLVNPYTISPAMAGYNFRSQVFIGYRKQWANIPESPQTSFASIVLPSFKRVWLGLSVISDQTSIYKYFKASLSYTYELPITENHFFRFSLWGNLHQNTINLENVHVADADDPLLRNKSRLVGTALNAGAGFVYQNRRLVLGLSVPDVFVNKDKYAVDSDKNLLVIERRLLAFGYYKYYLSDKWMIRPGMIYRTTKNSPASYDIFAVFKYMNTYWVGLIYRKESIIGISIGGHLLNDFTLNYSYEFMNNGFAGYTSGTHEITIGFNLKTPATRTGGEFRYYPMILEYNQRYRR